MGGLILGRAYVPGKGMHFVEHAGSRDVFRLRHCVTGDAIFRHRDRINWR